jgi:Fungal specific transcription factor domain
MQYDYLLHSMLGLGASHLALSSASPSELSSLGLNHRIKAMKLLNEVLAIPPADRAEADARFATFMVLVFQSACLPDGLYDFLTMLRGCVLQGDTESMGGLFSQFMEINHLQTIEAMLKNVDLEPLDTDVLDAGIFSLNQLQSYCKPGIELEYHEEILNGVQAAYISPRYGENFPLCSSIRHILTPC